MIVAPWKFALLKSPLEARKPVSTAPLKLELLARATTSVMRVAPVHAGAIFWRT